MVKTASFHAYLNNLTKKYLPEKAWKDKITESSFRQFAGLVGFPTYRPMLITLCKIVYISSKWGWVTKMRCGHPTIKHKRKRRDRKTWIKTQGPRPHEALSAYSGQNGRRILEESRIGIFSCIAALSSFWTCTFEKTLIPAYGWDGDDTFLSKFSSLLEFQLQLKSD